MTTTQRNNDPFGVRTTFESGRGPMVMYRLNRLEEEGIGQVSRLPYSIKVVLEAVLRQCDGLTITRDDVVNLARWRSAQPGTAEVPYKPARVILQDFTGVPAVVDLAALRSAMRRLGGDPTRINPIVPSDLVIDHSVQIDRFGSLQALAYNAKREFERNRERYEFLRWGQKAFDNFRVVPPSTGIVHQVNLEYLARVVQIQTIDGETVAFPDSLVGTDSHTTMVNGLGVVGWGVGGIEAEAVMLGQPIYMLAPEVIGVKITGTLPEGATATDVVLTVTQRLRARGVVDKFVEYYGPGISELSLADRATIANMSPEYGATVGFFPVDEETLRYLRGTGRSAELVQLVERYTKEQGLFRTDDSPEPVFTDTLELDLSTVEPCIAGPKRPQDRVPLHASKRAFWQALAAMYDTRVDSDADAAYVRWLHGEGEPSENWLAPQPRRRDLYRGQRVSLEVRGEETHITHGSVAIAAITSCTNTSNPSVMIAAGLLAKKAVEMGLRVPPYVKTSLAPGSRVVSRYLQAAGLTPYLQALGFHIAGYGCTTCIGNSGPLLEEVARAITDNDLVVAAVLSGNRNFEGRVHPLIKANYLASPPLVVAYALAGTVDIDLQTEPVGYGSSGEPVYLRDIWPSQSEIRKTMQQALRPELFETEYGNVFEGNETWNRIAIPEGNLYQWTPTSTYIQEPPFFVDLTLDIPRMQPIKGARVLALLGDSVTTDHISPAGAIPADSPAGRYLIERGVEPKDFNSFGSRRGNHEVMMRGTFGNIRLRNLLVPGSEGGVTVYLPPAAERLEDGERMSIYDAAMRYRQEGTPLLVIAGKEYGTGSSRDWAAKGTLLLGVRAVLAESYERIHRSNLVAMGVLPLQFKAGENAQTLGLTGLETYDIEGISDELQPSQEVTVRARDTAGKEKVFTVIVRINSPVEVTYYRNGGILHTVLREMVRSQTP
jgi:aconitate hydratase